MCSKSCQTHLPHNRSHTQADMFLTMHPQGSPWSNYSLYTSTSKSLLSNYSKAVEMREQSGPKSNQTNRFINCTSGGHVLGETTTGCLVSSHCASNAAARNELPRYKRCRVRWEPAHRALVSKIVGLEQCSMVFPPLAATRFVALGSHTFLFFFVSLRGFGNATGRCTPIIVVV